MKARDIFTMVVVDLLLTILFIAVTGWEARWGFFFFVILLFILWVVVSQSSSSESSTGPDRLAKELGIDPPVASILYRAGYRTPEDFEGAILDDLLMVEGIDPHHAAVVLEAVRKKIK